MDREVLIDYVNKPTVYDLTAKLHPPAFITVSTPPFQRPNEKCDHTIRCLTGSS